MESRNKAKVIEEVLNKQFINMDPDVLILLEDYLIETRKRERIVELAVKQAAYVERLQRVKALIDKKYGKINAAYYDAANSNGWRGGEPAMLYVDNALWLSQQHWNKRSLRASEVVNSAKKKLQELENLRRF